MSKLFSVLSVSLLALGACAPTLPSFDDIDTTDYQTSRLQYVFANARIVHGEGQVHHKMTFDDKGEKDTVSTVSGEDQNDFILALSRANFGDKRTGKMVYDNELCDVLFENNGFNFQCSKGVFALGNFEEYKTGGYGSGVTVDYGGLFHFHQYRCEDQRACRAQYLDELKSIR